MLDVAIVGAGPAGLSAALVLGRCGRRVVVFDSDKPRNAAARALHAFITRDGTPPLELRRLAREELARYPSVELRAPIEVTDIRRGENQFELLTADSQRTTARILLLASGRIDLVPTTRGFREFYGRGVYHCPYCDGWENRDRALVAYGSDLSAFNIALELLIWSRHVTLCTDGPAAFSDTQREKLRANGVALVESAVTELRGPPGGFVEAIAFADRAPLACDAVFFCSDCIQKSPFAENLGCRLDANGSVLCNGHAATSVPGLYVAGNVRGGIHLAIVAAAEGAEAAIAINDALHDHDLK